jgi:general secretion pathway protein G
MAHLIQEFIKKGGTFLKTKLSGFTLVELTVVLLIIGVLASILIPVVTNRVTDAKYTQALADIAKMETALAAYELDLQDFPPSGIQSLKQFLLHGSTGSANTAVKQWKGPYLDIKEDRIDNNNTINNTGDDKILDPWGNPYSYVHFRDYPTLGTQRAGVTGANEETWFNPRGFQIYSKGKNAITFAFPFAGTESDDVNNWFGDERQR